jgi:hypothetical protein
VFRFRRLSPYRFSMMVLLALSAVPAASAPKEGTGSASCSCYCKSKTADGVNVALPKTLKAPDGDITKCEFLAGIACKNTVPDDVSFGSLSLCSGLAESRRPPITRNPGKIAPHKLEPSP